VRWISSSIKSRFPHQERWLRPSTGKVELRVRFVCSALGAYVATLG